MQFSFRLPIDYFVQTIDALEQQVNSNPAYLQILGQLYPEFATATRMYLQNLVPIFTTRQPNSGNLALQGSLK